MRPLAFFTALALLLVAEAAVTGTAPRSAHGLASTARGLTEAPQGVRQGREGTITHMGPGYPASYLAIPLGPGIRVKVCGPARCLSMTSTDAGPNRASLQAGRIADVSMQTFERLCGCPASTGVFHGSWSRVSGPQVTLPPTDVAS